MKMFSNFVSKLITPLMILILIISFDSLSHEREKMYDKFNLSAIHTILGRYIVEEGTYNIGG